MFQLLTATLLIAQMSFSQHPSESTPAQEMRVALLEEGFTSKQVEILFGKYQRVFSPAQVAEVAKFLRQNGLTDVAKHLIQAPNLLSLSVDRSLESKMRWFKQQGVSDPSEILRRSPRVFTLSIPDNLAPKLAWFRTIDEIDLDRILRSTPFVLTYSLEENLQVKIQWMRDLGVKNIASVINKFPSILGLNIESKLNPKVAWFREIGIKNVSRILEKYPSLFGQSLEENLIPTWAEFSNQWGLSAVDLEKTPLLLSAKLDRVISLRKFLDRLASAAGEKSFPMDSLNLSQKTIMIQNFSASRLVASMEEFVPNAPTRISDFSDIPEKVFNSLVYIYRNKEFHRMITRDQSPAPSARGIIRNLCSRSLLATRN
jgi:hypothetical protein